MKYNNLILILVILSLLLTGCSKSNQQAAPEKETIQPEQQKTNQPNLPSAENSVTISNFKFSPSEIKINAGDTITWTNEDSMTHTVEFDDSSKTSDELEKKDTVSFTFDKKGTFNYHCGIHPSMKGTVIVE